MDSDSRCIYEINYGEKYKSLAILFKSTRFWRLWKINFPEVLFELTMSKKYILERYIFCLETVS